MVKEIACHNQCGKPMYHIGCTPTGWFEYYHCFDCDLIFKISENDDIVVAIYKLKSKI